MQRSRIEVIFAELTILWPKPVSVSSTFDFCFSWLNLIESHGVNLSALVENQFDFLVLFAHSFSVANPKIHNVNRVLNFSGARYLTNWADFSKTTPLQEGPRVAPHVPDRHTESSKIKPIFVEKLAGSQFGSTTDPSRRSHLLRVLPARTTRPPPSVLYSCGILTLDTCSCDEQRDGRRASTPRHIGLETWIQIPLLFILQALTPCWRCVAQCSKHHKSTLGFLIIVFYSTRCRIKSIFVFDFETSICANFGMSCLHIAPDFS